MALTSLAADATVRGRFQTEAPKEWQNLEEFVTHCEGSFDERTVVTPPGKTPIERRRKIRFAFCHNVSGEKISVSADGKASVFVSNERYSFELARNHAEGDLQLADYSTGPLESRQEDSLADGREWYSKYVLAAEYVSGVRLSSLLSGNSGQLRDVSTILRGGQQLVSITLVRQLGNTNELFRGTVLLNPTFHWAVVEYDQAYPWGSIKASIDYYQSEIPEVAFPRRLVQREYDRAGRLGTELTYEFDLPEKCSATREDFTLAAYGLPEIPETAMARRWLLIGINATILLALLYLYFRRRKTSRAAVT